MKQKGNKTEEMRARLPETKQGYHSLCTKHVYLSKANTHSRVTLNDKTTLKISTGVLK